MQVSVVYQILEYALETILVNVVMVTKIFVVIVTKDVAGMEM